TDIAVIFLDTAYRIRRYTPAAKALLDLIGTDVGRPLSHLAKKFTDAELMDDAVRVLDKLVPIGREISAESGRWYLRRILPYRTTDDRIEGVVLTFVDITTRRQTDQALSESRGQLAGEIRTLTSLHDLTNKMLVTREINAALGEVLGAVVAVQQ